MRFTFFQRGLVAQSFSSASICWRRVSVIIYPSCILVACWQLDSLFDQYCAR
ncbi:Uncharacterised protein [Vibrio cholerae]|nr:Uncharacterised protein [Vibrio cholerae]CSI40003.1 Uncharacterised protein [Vibrio cholerae]